MMLKDIKEGQKFIFVGDTNLKNYETSAVPVYIMMKNNGEEGGYTFVRMPTGNSTFYNSMCSPLHVILLEF